MLVYFGADHRGFNLKEIVKAHVKDKGYEVADAGNLTYDKDDDFVDFAVKVAEKVSLDSERSRGFLFCGSGAGMDVAANKFRHVRATLGLSIDQTYAVRHEDDVNVLVIASDFTNEADAKGMADVFLATTFENVERRRRRLDKISEIENLW